MKGKYMRAHVHHTVFAPKQSKRPTNETMGVKWRTKGGKGSVHAKHDATDDGASLHTLVDPKSKSMSAT